MKQIFLLCSVFFLSLGTFANNILVSNITYNSGAGTVTFNISWENSWRVSTAPNNWDAAWIFVKRRNCADAFWRQQYLAVTGHTTASPLEIKTVPDTVGVFIQRSANGSGNIAATSVTLKLGSIPTPLNEWDFKVYAVEMVYVPQDTFYLGSGGNARYEFRNGGSGTPGVPYKVTSENAITFSNVSGNLWDNSGANSAYAPANNVVDANFPKGYRAFYAMKYELSQGQYTDFLNSLPQDMAQGRQILPGGANRNTVDGVWPSYTCTTPYRAMNFLAWADLCGYLDWSGLAPMSEMEYEKLCRGKAFPISSEYAWGTNTITRAFTVLNDGTAQEGVSDPVALGTGFANLGNSNGLEGPLRVGFAAKNATSRTEAGAGYYGNMDLTGNVLEFCTGIYSTASTIFKWNAHGDGQLEIGTGNSNVSGWLNQTDVYGQVKGGSWYFATLDDTHKVSDRGTGANNYNGSNNSNTGGRGVRRVFN